MILTFLLTISSLVSAGEKDKYFAGQCYDAVETFYAMVMKEKLQSNYAYFPLETQEKKDCSGRIFTEDSCKAPYKMTVRFNVIKPWGEEQTFDYDCHFNKSGTVVTHFKGYLDRMRGELN